MRRPRIAYSDAVAARIFAELDRGRPLLQICRDDGMPGVATVHAWVRENRDGFGERYRAHAPKMGAPLTYSRAAAAKVCDELRAGRSLLEVCRDDGMPTDHAVRQWMKSDRDGFAARYRQAREIGYLALADEIIAIADANEAVQDGADDAPESVERSRLRVSVRCAQLARVLPRDARSDDSDPVREMLRLIDGRTRGLPTPAQCCPHCGGSLRK
jgi:hypothetical protein